MGNAFGSLFGDCILSNNVKEQHHEEQEYKKRIETTLTSLNDKIDENRHSTKEEIKEIKDEIKEVRTETRDGIKDLKDDLKFYYGRGRSKNNLYE